MDRVSKFFDTGFIAGDISDYNCHDIGSKKISKNLNTDEFLAYENVLCKKKKYMVNILAMGDVGSTLLLGLRLLGGDIIEAIGIFDINREVTHRFEMEMNQISYPFFSGDGCDEKESLEDMPAVKVLKEEEIFNCDVFLFCPSVMVPEVDKKATEDVRMVQYEGNKKLVEKYVKKAKENEFNGIFAVMSDPVDPLCQCAVNAGLNREKVRGFGLGVMNARALYHSMKNKKFGEYKFKGRAYGPHGKDLVIANDIDNYDDDLSKELTELAVNANLEMRKIGFKPYIAPAISSGAISVIEFLKNRWHYSSISFGEVFLGIKNKLKNENVYFENPKLDIKLLCRIENAINNLKNINREGK